MKAITLLSFVLLLSGCVTERMSEDGKSLPPEWNAPPNEDLPLSAEGHFLCTVTRIIDPVTVVV
ncbi:MAG: hypothetical protein HUU29_12645, partial [Planctomycetaceae bacterium]|nr:hypothetical protein [Planctomycetaceae bacterium]